MSVESGSRIVENEPPLRYAVRLRETQKMRYLTLVNEDTNEEMGVIEYVPHFAGNPIHLRIAKKKIVS